MCDGALILLGHSTPPLPPVPTRAQVCGVQLTFQGLTVYTVQFGWRPWFELALQCLTSENDRQAVYRQKLVAGDTHAIVEFLPGGSVYNEAGVWLQQAISPNYEADPSAFLALVVEIVQAGLTPIVVFNGDNGDDPTDGYPNALRQLPMLANLLGSYPGGDLNRYVLYGRLWDGVFYGSTPAHIQTFGQHFRALIPNGYLAIEHQPGRIPVGNGGSDYAPGGMMTDYDVIMSEFDGPLNATWRATWNGGGYNGDQIWQVAARMLGPAYVRPPEQPATDDPDGARQWYLAPGSPRGPYVPVWFETSDPGAYTWVRGDVTAAQCAAARAYGRSLGYRYAC